MAELQVLRVFVAPDGRGGNPLGVFADAGPVDAATRQAVAARLGFSETVFVEDRRRGALRVHTPAIELGFAGHPLVGSAWALPEHDVLHPPAGEVVVRREPGRTWIGAHAEQCPAWDLVELAQPALVDGLAGPPGASGHVCCWAWADESHGLVRARVFAPDYGVPEDPATGSAAIRLCASLGRPLTIHQGAASQILVHPLADGRVELGGRVERDLVRDEPL
jgi:predicted PhzF superfamily epimerase YddE/YHI9